MILRRRGFSAPATQAVVMCGVTTCAVLLTCAIGCQNESLGRERLEMRGGQIDYVVDSVMRSEDRHFSAMDATANRLCESVADDGRGVAEDTREFDEYLRGDAHRWLTRLPDYRRHAEQILWGAPDTIVHDAIILFY